MFGIFLPFLVLGVILYCCLPWWRMTDLNMLVEPYCFFSVWWLITVWFFVLNNASHLFILMRNDIYKKRKHEVEEVFSSLQPHSSILRGGHLITCLWHLIRNSNLTLPFYLLVSSLDHEEPFCGDTLKLLQALMSYHKYFDEFLLYWAGWHFHPLRGICP